MTPGPLRKGAKHALVAVMLTSATALPATAQPARHQGLILERSAEDLATLLATERASSVEITRACLERISALNRQLRAVIAVSPEALTQAQASDARRRAGNALGALEGIPVLIKDNIDTRELPTTAGSLALRDNMTGRDAFVVSMLRAQGAIILGKTNLTEWSNGRSTNALLGWSAVGGLVRNPYALDRSPCGSSGGSAVAVAASMAPLAVGTETHGSVTCPASMNGLVGLKPTLGMISRTHIVPYSRSQDTPGPMARTVRDVALLFGAMVGSDPADSATHSADARRTDFVAGLQADALDGKRIGYWKPAMSERLAVKFDQALEQLAGAGAVLVQVEMPRLEQLSETEGLVVLTELKAGLDAYLASTPTRVKVRTLADLIAFNDTNRAEEMSFFGQDLLLEAATMKSLADRDYLDARGTSSRLAGEQGIDAMLTAGGVDLLVTPTFGAAWLSDPVLGDRFTGPDASQLPAVSGYPHLTVPMGLIDGLPVGLSFIGPAWSDHELLSAGYAYEQRTKARRAPTYLQSVEADLDPRAADCGEARACRVLPTRLH